MDAGADPLRGSRPDEVEEKPKSLETQDDGYETSNSGEALRRKPSSGEGSPAQPPPPAHPPPGAPEHYELARHYHHHFPRYEPEPPEYYPYQKYDAYAFKREPQPYDMSGQQYQVEGKRELEDPYSFVEEEGGCGMLPPQHHALHPHHMQHPLMLQQPKKRGRKKKLKDENGMEIKVEGTEVGPVRVVKERKKHDRFNGMSEEEVARRTLPDHLAQNLDIIIIGINPGLFAAYKGHHYAGPGNHFWKCLYLSGLTREQMSADEDYKLLNFGIGFTNMVSRPTKGSADLTRREIKEGSSLLLDKLLTYRPKVAVFNGKLIYEVFSGKKDFCFGKQPETVQGTNTYMWVMPSSSARCAQLPRAADKVPYYAALKKFRDFLNGLLPTLDEAELVFPDTTSRRPQDELEIRRLTMEPEPGDTIILDDGTEVPLKKKRGRPKKIKLENGEVAPPAARAPRAPRPPPPPPAGPDGDAPKKKRGRPKKVRGEEGAMTPHLLHDHYLHQQQHQAGGAGGGEFPGGGGGAGGADVQMYPHHEQTYFHQPGGSGSSGGGMEAGYYSPRYSHSQHSQYPGSPGSLSGAAPAHQLQGTQGNGMPGTPTGMPGTPTGMPGTPGGISGAQSGMPGTPSGMPGTPSGMPGTPSGTPSGMPGTPGGMPGTPGGMPGTPGGFSPGRTFSPAHCSPMYQHPSPVQQGNNGGGAPLPRPYSRSPGAGGAGGAGGTGAGPAGGGGGGGYSPYASPYSARSSPAPLSHHAHHYPPHQSSSSSCESAGGGGMGALGELADIGTAPSPGPPPDFDPPRRDRAGEPHDERHAERHDAPPDTGDRAQDKCGNGNGNGNGNAHLAFGERLYLHNDDKDYSHLDHELSGGVGSPRMDQLHQHPALYSTNYARATPESGHNQGAPSQPFSPHAHAHAHAGAGFRPADHQPGSPVEFSSQLAKPKPQDVSAKSLSGLESLVDQIPSIAEGGGGGGGGASGAEAGGAVSEAPPPAPLPDYPAPLYSHYPAYPAAHHYQNNGYGSPFVGYGGGWGVRGGGYLAAAAAAEWQPYSYPAPYYPPAPYLPGPLAAPAAPAPPHHPAPHHPAPHHPHPHHPHHPHHGLPLDHHVTFGSFC